MRCSSPLPPNIHQHLSSVFRKTLGVRVWFNKAMDVYKEVQKLQQVIFDARQDIKHIKTASQATAPTIKLDKSIQTLGIRIRNLKETTSSLSSAEGQCEKRLDALKTGLLLPAESVAERDSNDLIEAGESLQKIQSIVALRKNSAAIGNMRTPPLAYSVVGFKERMKNDDTLTTDPFYTHPSGYKMCLVIHFNGYGEGKGNHISVFLKILLGEFDEILQWPFSGRIVIQLLNQRKDKLHHTQTICLESEGSLPYRQRPDPKTYVSPKDRQSWGHQKFISHVELPAKGMFADCEYLKNDSLTFRVYKVDMFTLRY